MRITCGVLQDMVLLQGWSRHTCFCLCALTVQWPCRSTQTPATWRRRKDAGIQKRRRNKEGKKPQHVVKIGKQRRQEGCTWEGMERFFFLLFTNIFISSLVALMWLTTVCCSNAVSSSSSSSSSSSKGLEPGGAVLLSTVRLTTWDTVSCRYEQGETHVTEGDVDDAGGQWGIFKTAALILTSVDCG